MNEHTRCNGRKVSLIEGAGWIAMGFAAGLTAAALLTKKKVSDNAAAPFDLISSCDRAASELEHRLHASANP